MVEKAGTERTRPGGHTAGISLIRSGWASGAILAGAAVLVLLTWIGTVLGTRVQRDAAEAQVASNVTSQALMFREQLRRQLVAVEQTLRIVGESWQSTPDRFDLAAWNDRIVLLHDVAHELSVIDAGGTVRHSTDTSTVGRDIRDRETFQHAQAQPAAGLYVGSPALDPSVGHWHLNMAWPLRDQNGSFTGLITAAFEVDALTQFYRTADVGGHGIIAVVNTETGQILSSAGDTVLKPGSSIGDSDVFKAMRAHSGAAWTGHSALDGRLRVHGFQLLPDRTIGVIVSVDEAEAMRPTDVWQTAAYIFAGGITGLLAIMSAILLQQLVATRRREASLARDRATLARANAELALAKAQTDAKSAQLAGTLDGMSDGVAMVDARLKLVEWNSNFPKIAGIPAERLHVGMTIEDILREQAQTGQFGAVDVETEVAVRAAALRAGRFAERSERSAPGDRMIELRRNRLPDGGFVTLFTDVTARKQAEDALREANRVAAAATEAMSRFVAVVSHEIRTPLNALLNSLALLADANPSPAQQPLLDAARRSGDALRALIDDILEMSRMEAGQLVLRPARFALRPLVERAFEMFAAQAAERRIALRLTIGSEVPAELYADPGRLRQVLINLLSNAVKFAARGEVRVTANLLHGASERTLRLAVRDRGPVIPPADRARLFQPFLQLDSDGGQHGTGLGLTICRQIITLMGGHIGCDVWMVGQREAGNEFWLTIPLAEPPRVLLSAPAVPTRQALLPRTRILLVEDVDTNRLVTATMLRRNGHCVDLAHSGEQALRMLATHPYDMVFMDVSMPGVSGLETTRLIRAMPGPAGTVPVVALTGKVGGEDRAACRAAGMNDVLSKPLTQSDLLKALELYVWPHRRPQPLAEWSRLPNSAQPSSLLALHRIDELRAILPPRTLVELGAQCIEELRQRLATLQAVLQGGRVGEVRAEVHAMAGIAAEYGLAALEARLGALGRAVHSGGGELAAAAVIAQELTSDIAAASDALREALQTEMA